MNTAPPDLQGSTGSAIAAGAADREAGGVRYSRFELPAVTAVAEGPTTGDGDDAALLAANVDAAFYLASFAPDAAAKRDPAGHFHSVGWQAGRDPNPWFDTGYYLAANPDVRAIGRNPLLHYLRSGRAEGRPTRRPGGMLRQVADAVTPPARRRPGHHIPKGGEPLDVAILRARIVAACRGKRGLVVALSHDRYIDTTGGMQIFIADEEAQFNGDRIAYLHIAPVIARLTLAAEDAAPMPLQLAIDGRVLGVALSDEVVAALAGLDDSETGARLFIVHSLFGHRCSVVAALAAALRPGRCFFWLHDYASLCSGYNLLRNDAVFCGGPPEDSMACRVCVYGDGRAAYRGHIQALFAAVPFDVVAPSEAALEIWRQASDGLRFRSLRVHPNAMLRPAGESVAKAGPIRVAYVGYPIPAKGWSLFHEIFRRLRASPDFAFHHFANPEVLRRLPGLRGVATKVDRFDRLAMARAIAAADIDLVVMFCPWPETFSYVTREAFAGGADVVTLASSGGVAEAVRAEGSGVVLADAAAALGFFLGDQVRAYVAAQRAAPRRTATMLACGTTATFDPLTPVLDPARLATDDPSLVVVAGDAVLDATRDGAAWWVDLPEDCATVRLISRFTVPARLDPEGGDYRRLGLAVASLTLDGAEVANGDARRSTGWHGATPEDAVQWTSGDARLETAGARRLGLVLAPGARYQRCKLVA